MVTCDRCGSKLKKKAKFCAVCGDNIIWPEKSKEKKTDKFSKFFKQKGTRLLDDNLPEEYIEKIKGSISDFHETAMNPDISAIEENVYIANARDNVAETSKSIKESASSFINESENINQVKETVLNVGESVKDSSSRFLNNHMSQETQEKIMSDFGKASSTAQDAIKSNLDSQKELASKTSTAVGNIQEHRLNVKKQKIDDKNALEEAQAKELEEDWMRKQRQIEENHINAINDIRQTRSASIDFPRIVRKNSTNGAIKGEIMGNATGRALEGFFGNNNNLSSTLNAGLILGGAGAVIGGLLDAADDGLRWEKALLYIADEELIISGKYSISFDDIKLVNTARFKDNDMVVITLNDKGIEFRTNDASALKIVIDEYMEQYISSKRKPSNVDELLKYGELYEKGIITKEEMELKKKELF